MGIADGNVTGVTKVLDQGPDSSQWNLVVMGDGYTATQQSSFDSTVDNFIDILVTVPPFSEAATWDHVNVHRINIESNETGADDPAACADGTAPFLGIATTAATYLDAARDRCVQAGARGGALMRRLNAIYGRVGPLMARFVRPRRRLADALRTCVLAPWARHLRRREGMV